MELTPVNCTTEAIKHHGAFAKEVAKAGVVLDDALDLGITGSSLDALTRSREIVSKKCDQLMQLVTAKSQDVSAYKPILDEAMQETSQVKVMTAAVAAQAKALRSARKGKK